MNGTGSAALSRPSEYIVILRRIQFIAELIGLYLQIRLAVNDRLICLRRAALRLIFFCLFRCLGCLGGLGDIPAVCSHMVDWLGFIVHACIR